MAKKRKKKNLFGKFYFAYLFVILAALVLLFFHVRSVMVDYEKSQPDNYVIALLKHAGKGDKALGDYLQENCFAQDEYGDPKTRSNEFYNTDAHAKLTAAKNLSYSEGDVFVYDVNADDKPFITVAIEKSGEKRMLGIFNVSSYKLKYAFVRNPETKKPSFKLSDEGTVSFSVVLPKDFTLQFNGADVDISGASESPIEDFSYISDYDQVPTGAKMDFTLHYDPIIKVMNNVGEEVKLNLDITPEGNIYYAAADYGTDSAQEAEVKKVGDFLSMYKLWARFMTDDVGGYYHGYYEVKEGCKIMPGSKLEDQAWQWATSIDITFVSDHWSIEFENENVDNYILYNDDFCSADVRFDEIVNVSGVGPTTVKYNNRMFFIREDGEWYWVGQLDLTGR
ncbi:MAG: hypothetical protein IJJ48_08145 [Firmicutes bacterium]|nr:hypothetical protein [Bacillota bacterium]